VFLTKKLVGYFLLAVAVIVFNFLLPRLLPGSPVRNAGMDDGGSMTRVEREQIYAAYNLDKPLPEQFLLYLQSIFTGDLGLSFSRRAPITRILGAALPWTVLLSVSSTLLSLLLGSLLGSWSVRLRRKKRDVPLILGVSLLGSFPAFWVGMVLIAVFSVWLGVLPMFGAYSMWSNYTGFRYVVDVARHLAMPLVTMSIGSLMLFFTTTRTGLLAVLNEDYIMLAEVRGLPGRRIRFFYQWRNALIPVFTVLMLHLGFIFSGSVVIEAVFSYPGVGKVLYDAVLARDYPLMQYSFLLIAFTVILANIIAVLLYPVLDPRIRKA